MSITDVFMSVGIGRSICKENAKNREVVADMENTPEKILEAITERGTMNGAEFKAAITEFYRALETAEIDVQDACALVERAIDWILFDPDWEALRGRSRLRAIRADMSRNLGEMEPGPFNIAAHTYGFWELQNEHYW